MLLVFFVSNRKVLNSNGHGSVLKINVLVEEFHMGGSMLVVATHVRMDDLILLTCQGNGINQGCTAISFLDFLAYFPLNEYIYQITILCACL